MLHVLGGEIRKKCNYIDIQMVLSMLRWSFLIYQLNIWFEHDGPRGPSSVRFRWFCSYTAGHGPLVILTPDH